MPQAAQETVEEVEAFLTADEPLDVQACRYLRDHGYELTRNWDWSKPSISDYGDMTRKEFACLMHMCHEWDYGGLANA